MNMQTDIEPDLIYLDCNATTRTDPEVVAEMLPFFCDMYGNPSSGHGASSAPADAVRRARTAVRYLLGAERDEEIIFTSGGSEADNLALWQAVSRAPEKNEIITSAVEHPAILNTCAMLEKNFGMKVHYIPVDEKGALDEAAYEKALGPKTALVSFMWANNETGTLFPIAKLARMAHASGALFHTDAVQAAGKIEICVERTDIDMLSISGHKFHGPKGIGVLYARHGLKISPMICGGRQERARRAGTENVPGIVGIGCAAILARKRMAHDTRMIETLRKNFETAVLARIPDCRILGDTEHRLPGTTSVAFTGAESEVILHDLDQAGICASAGSACMAGGMEPSHVLKAMHIPFPEAQGTIRFSFSRDNRPKDLDRVLCILPPIVTRARAISPFAEAQTPLHPLRLG